MNVATEVAAPVSVTGGPDSWVQVQDVMSPMLGAASMTTGCPAVTDSGAVKAATGMTGASVVPDVEAAWVVEPPSADVIVMEAGGASVLKVPDPLASSGPKPVTAS